MTTMHMLWIVWGGIAMIAVGLLVYRGMLTRYEEDQLFLNDAILTEEHQRQEHLQQRLHQVQPYINVVGVAASIMFVGLVGTVTWQAWLQLQ